MNILSERLVTTRKSHRCWGCGEMFPRGVKLHLLTQTDEGEIRTTYWCDVCKQYWDQYMQDSDGIAQGDLAGEYTYKEFTRQYYDRSHHISGS